MLVRLSTSTPPTPPRRRLPAAERRELIELAATEVFAERGFRGAGMDEIARRSGISVPVLYDHFPSKLALYERLLERHYADLRDVWGRHLVGGADMGTVIDAWFAYVEAHPFASRLLFRDTTGDPEVEATRREVAAASRDALLPLIAANPAVAAHLGESPHAAELLWELLRASLQGLALWWAEHPEVPREEVVGAAMNGLWVGLERLLGGERWTPAT